MPTPIILPSFAAGEISPALHGRVDLAKYQVGLATCLNWFIHPFGGASTRAGTAFAGEVVDHSVRSRLIPFQFSQAQAYALEFSHQKLRFIIDGGYLLEAAATITGISQAASGVVTTSGAHGFTSGDHVWLDGIAGMTELNRRRVTATVLSGTTFSIGIDTSAYGAWTSGGTAARFYTVATPYDAADLPLLKYIQSADRMTLTHPSYETRHLIRSGSTSWSLNTGVFAPAVEPPTGLASNAAGSSFFYVLTAVDDTTGEESLQSAEVGSSTQTSAISFTAVANCTYYNVYKKKNGVFGFVGRVTAGSTFTDATITADVSDTPPGANNPFGGAPLLAVTVTNGGAGYVSPTLGVTDPTGSGAVLTPTMSAGAFVSVAVTNAGTSYSNPTITISDGGGSGATFQLNWVVGGQYVAGYDPDGNPVLADWFQLSTVTVLGGGAGYQTGAVFHTTYHGIVDHDGMSFAVTVVAGAITAVSVVNGGGGQFADDLGGFPSPFVVDSTGTGAVLTATINTDLQEHPGCSTYHDGRQWFARTNKRPQTLYASVSAAFNNMNASSPTKDSDAITRTIASREVNEIRFLLSLGTLLVFTSGGEWKCWAGSQSDVITPANCSVKPQGYSGIAQVPPIATANSALFVTPSGRKVRDVAYEFSSDSFSGREVSILASHLFEGLEIEEWAYARDPDGIVWCVRSDGVMLGFTYLKEHDVYAWSRHVTDGAVESVCAIQEQSETALYLAVRRTLGGQTVRYVERMASRYFPDVYASWCVDSGYSYNGWNDDATKFLAVSGATYNAGDTVLLATTGHAPFTVASAGSRYILRSGQNQVTVTVLAYITTSSVFATLDTAPNVALQATAVSDWALATDTLAGLWHLEGKTVALLADGSVQPSTVVANGQATIPRVCGRILAGLPYACDLETLDIEQGQLTLQGRRKAVGEVVLRVKDTRGLSVGPDAVGLTDIKERTTEQLGYPTMLTTGDERVLIDPSWNSNGRIFVRQSNPLPATVVAIIPRLEIGE